MDLTLAVVKNIPGVLAKPRPKVIFTDWDDTYVLFKINVWIESKGGMMVKVKNRVIMDIYNAYNEAGIDVPYPIQTIHMDKGDEEFSPQDQIDKKVAEIKKRIKDKQLVAANKTIVAPASPVAPVQPASPALPTAIETTPNNAGQAWLQQALNQQVSSTTTPAPVQPVENTAPVVQQPAAPVEAAPVNPITPSA